MTRLLPVLLTALHLAACSGQAAAPQVRAAPAEVDSARVVGHLRFLSSPSLEGRATGTPGNREARDYIQREMQGAGLRPFPNGWLQSFPAGERQAANVIGYVPGTQRPDLFLVLTAHFDHLGARGGTIYPGADDNASGTAALLEIARQLASSPARHSIIFAALDAEEIGLLGARAFLADPPVQRRAMLLNVNMDMVGRNEAGELYAAGTFHHPWLLPLVEAVARRSRLTLLPGHDRPTLPPGDDWTMQSDHGAFHEVGIPFVYFGVEDHPDYHRPTDSFERIDQGFFVEAVRTVLDFVREADRTLGG